MTDPGPTVAGWHFTYQQPTGACNIITVGLTDFDAARAAAEKLSNFIPADTLVGHGSVNRETLVRYGMRPGSVALTSP